MFHSIPDNPDWLEAQKVKLEGLNDRLKGMVVRPDKLEEPVRFITEDTDITTQSSVLTLFPSF